MSKIKKKTNKHPTRLRVLVASLLMLNPMTYAADSTDGFSDKPLVGVSESFAPHVVLALSVEYPTAGAAYSETTEFSFANGDHRKQYRGYFDNQKCYKYNETGGFFYPSSLAKSDTTTGWGRCNNGATDEYSGNLLNFMTMTAVDVFRYTMTGGNRAQALGTAALNNDPSTADNTAHSNAYKNGDTETETYLRRANVVPSQNGGPHNGMNKRTVKIGAYANIAKNYLPHQFVVESDNASGKSPAELGYKVETYGLASYYITNFPNPTANGTRLNNSDGTLRTSQYISVQRKVDEFVGVYDEFAEPDTVRNDLLFTNTGFSFTISGGRYKTWLNESRTDPDGWHVKSLSEMRALYGPKISSTQIADLNTTNAKYAAFNYYAEGTAPTVRGHFWSYNPKIAKKTYNAVVKVCDSSVGVEANCIQYGSNYKPEGLLQRYTRDKDMRFATVGYLNKTGNDISGGVLRSRMKKLLNDPDADKGYGNEWDTKTGVLERDPDKKDSAQSTKDSGSPIINSGTINYLNKFGDLSGYKGNDPAAELYYTALAYLRGSNVGNAPYQFSGYTDAADKIKAYDNFPAIYDWDDPMKRGIKKGQYQCHQNSIILIGDTNTHHDYNLPNFAIPGYTTASDFTDVPGAPNKQTDVKTSDYLQRLYTAQGRTDFASRWWGNTGSSLSPSGMAGLAYWARVNDIRRDNDDFPGVQNGNNFIIDVVESGNYKATANAYYLAAKYGGFTRTDNSTDLDPNFPLAQKELPTERSSWTDDAVGQSTVTAFPDGTPRNYAVANNPDAMVSALEKAMLAGGAINNPTQAATGLSVNLGDTLDFTNGNKPITLQSTYNFAQLTGDMVAYETEYAPDADAGTLLKQTEKWRASTALNSFYHGPNYATRKLYTVRDNTVYDFTVANANNIFKDVAVSNGDADRLASYILGNNADENTVYRTRSSLMGTVINSTVTPIVKVTNNAPTQCQYRNETQVRNRQNFYSVAANDGILHIVDKDGQPVAGYMAGVAVDKLNDFADRNYTHKYLNDGTPVVSELCMGLTSDASRVAKSVLLGTTGRGGGAVYALDVTDLTNVSKDMVMWEFSSKNDSDLGLTVSKPIITTAPDGRPIAVVSSGYNNQTGGSIFILDISKDKSAAWTEGVNYWQISLGNSGVGTPFVYDQDNDGVADKIFVGDLDGKVWQIDRKADTGTGGWAIPYAGNAPLFTPSETYKRPITGAPYADTVAGKLMVIVGTGKYFAETDLSPTQQNYAYGFIVNGTTPVSESNLLEQQIQSTPVTGDNVKLNADKVSVYSVTSNPMNDTHQGWRLQLLEGQNIAADALIRQKQAAEFIAARITDNATLQCSRSGSTSYISVDPSTGGLNKNNIFDTNGDGIIDANDAAVGVFEMKGITTSVMTVFKLKKPDGTVQLIARASDGGTGGGSNPNGGLETPLKQFGSLKGVRRISWREIF